uniref:Peptidase aspartic putative domain-containing protein n=1 Tax=Glossina pallidipes TaxID=7398 RepID=A0A1A9ZW71_GLOPL
MELKTGVDAVHCSSKKLDKALLALKIRRTVTEQQSDCVNDFAKRIQEDSSGVSLDELNKLKALHSAFDAFSKVQTKIEEKDFDEISQPNRSKYEELYYYIATTLKVCISKLNNSDSNQAVHTSHAILPGEKYDTVKLPKIELREFSGDLGSMNSPLVHNNERVNSFTKLHHLVSKLSPAVKPPIAGIKIIAGNYEIILQRLKDRFENKKIIGNQHIKQIFEHPKVIYANPADLRELIDTMNNHLIGLENINRPVESWDDLMVYIITSKVDPDTLNKRCQILESNLSSVSLPGGASTSRAIGPKGVQRTARSFVTIKNCCSFCQNPGHVIYRCSDFLSLSAADRLNKVHTLKLCVNCLKFKKHNLCGCTSNGRCHTCGKGHHSLLHFERPQVANYTASKYNQIDETNHIEPAGTANHNMSDQAQPKNFAAVKTQHRRKYTSYSNCLYYIEI